VQNLLKILFNFIVLWENMDLILLNTKKAKKKYKNEIQKHAFQNICNHRLLMISKKREGERHRAAPPL